MVNGNKTIQFDEITTKLIGCVNYIHQKLGNGSYIGVYKVYFPIALEMAGLTFETERKIVNTVDANAIEPPQIDFFVENRIMVILKRVTFKEKDNQQIRTYLKAYNLPIALFVMYGIKEFNYQLLYDLDHPDNKNLNLMTFKS